MDDVEALTTIVNILKKLDIESQRRVLHSVHTFLGIPETVKGASTTSSISSGVDSLSEQKGRFSRDRSMSPKDFFRDKMPNTDVERVACIAYYLAHYRDTPHFKTIDVSALNTEAAQPKFSNASFAVDNASKLGYLVSANKGNKQISAAGERFVELLPDREAARDAMKNFRRRRPGKRSQFGSS